MGKVDRVRERARKEESDGIIDKIKGPYASIFLILFVIIIASLLYFTCWIFASPTQREPQLIGNGDFINYSVNSLSESGWNNGTVHLIFNNFTQSTCSIDFISNDSAYNVGSSTYNYTYSGGVWMSDGLTALL